MMMTMMAMTILLGWALGWLKVRPFELVQFCALESFFVPSATACSCIPTASTLCGIIIVSVIVCYYLFC